jgi:hypothetical protein
MPSIGESSTSELLRLLGRLKYVHVIAGSANNVCGFDKQENFNQSGNFLRARFIIFAFSTDGTVAKKSRRWLLNFYNRLDNILWQGTSHLK